MRLFRRDAFVVGIAGLMLVFTGWAWGGVVLWTQFVSCGLGAVAFLVALTPRDPSSPWRPQVRRGFAISGVIGALAATVICGLDASTLSEQRASTQELLPETILQPLSFSDWGLRGLGVGVAAAFAGMFITAFRTPTHTRKALLRFPPFWIGLALFTYIALQSLNPWGLVVERDLAWKIIPQDHVDWLPAGLAAPFVGDNDPGGMNGWRQMLVLSGPWMLLCALRISIGSERVFVGLAWLTGINALAIGIVGNMVSAARSHEFLGYKPWPGRQPMFGPFVYKNHAGVYLYIAAAIVLALAAYLIVRKGSRADRGGSHLLAGLLFVLLVGASASTVSIGCMIAAASLLLLAPVLYFTDIRINGVFSPLPAVILLACGCILGYAAVDSGSLEKYRRRIEQKQVSLERMGSDDRAPIRRAAYAQMSDATCARLIYGSGAGSYRWVSPIYFAQQPEFLDYKGRLRARANYAHCDWIQALLELGVAGSLFVVAAAAWAIGKVRAAVRFRSAQLIILSAAILLPMLHASLDFILYFTPHLTLLALACAWIALAEERRACEPAGEAMAL